MQSNDIIRRMEKRDVPRMAELERLCFPTPWSAKALAGELKNDIAYYLVLERDGVVVGYAGSWIMFDEAHITNVAVDPNCRRQGLGMRIMLAMMQGAKERGATRMTLEVREHNYGAQALYAKCGFVKAGIRPGYYSDTGEAALILWNDDIPASLEKLVPSAL
ncbi:MAG: ribosomal protein S18-alanine N-acetyltransferase [Clostridia bacterium]|nr:ribosomal protein S18-alanine N-acetyltransferase [Clostridia bacterium]